MRPYLAVLKDALREAVASRILWLLTGLITLVLFVGLAPFALREESAARFQRNEFRNGPGFLKFLTSQEKEERPTAARRIVERLPDALRERLHEVRPGNVREQVEILSSVRNELNGMLDSTNLYDAAYWPPKMLSEESKRLIDRGLSNLSSEERRRLNRLLIEAAYPDYVIPAPGKVLYAAWFGYRLGAALPFEPKQLGLLVNFALAALTTFLAGVLGVFIAILVTAPIVPLTFEPGAIDLLLSKPVSRSLLFLTKFFGATAFILLNSIYLIGGMWLIAGLRFDIWSTKLLMCIPVFLFLFVIYYSVSALTGVIWRNAVVSVCCTILFWALCFAVGTAKGVVEATFLNPARLATIVPASDKLLAVNRSGQTFEWSADKHLWEEVFRGRGGMGPAAFFRGSLAGPAYDPKADRIYAMESTPTRFEFFGGAGKLLVGPRNEDWRRIESAIAPNAGQSIFVDPQGRIIVASLLGLYRFEGDPTLEHRPFKVLGVDIAPQDRTARFISVGPSPEPKWRQPFNAAMNPDDGRVAVLSRGTLIVLSVDGAGRYKVSRSVDLGTDKPAVLAFAGRHVSVVTGEGRARVFAADTLQEVAMIAPHGRRRPRAAAASPDGRWLAVAFRDGRLWMYDLARGASFQPSGVRKSDVSAVAFSPTSRLYVADHIGRVTAYEMEPFALVATYEPPAETLELIDRFLLAPLYTVFPKPSELDGVVSYLLIDEPIDLFNNSPAAVDDPNADKPTAVDIWQSIWSNLLFLAGMLALTCIYVARRDF